MNAGGARRPAREGELSGAAAPAVSALRSQSGRGGWGGARTSGASLIARPATETVARRRGTGRWGGDLGRGAGEDERLNVFSEPAGKRDGLRGRV